MARQLFLSPGERAHVELPYSEVCMHLGIAGRILPVEFLGNGAVQVYDGDDRKLSFPILASEAGFHFSDSVGGWYCYGDYAMNAPADDSDDEFDNRPWGEQQSQIDWLETRYDDYSGGEE